MAGSGELVVLRDGVSARVEPYLLLIRLEAEGYRLTLDSHDQLYVAPVGRLPEADVALLRQFKPDIISLLRYLPDDSHLREPATTTRGSHA